MSEEQLLPGVWELVDEWRTRYIDSLSNILSGRLTLPQTEVDKQAKVQFLTILKQLLNTYEYVEGESKRASASGFFCYRITSATIHYLEALDSIEQSKSV